MTFVSFYFYIFLAVLVAMYYIMPLRFRWTVLLAGSMIFYFIVSGFSKISFAILLAEATLCYVSGLLMRRYTNKSRLIMGIAVIFTVFPLLIVKRLFIIPDIIKVSNPISLVVPVGIAYFTLQLIAYVVDVYKHKIEPEKNYFKFILFVSFFPQVIQGPIPRFSQLSHQLVTGHEFNEKNFVEGFKMILWGFFLKLCIADKSAVVVNNLFTNYMTYRGAFVFFAGSLYCVQLYADFLSCTTIAQGVSRLFGIELADNFERPFFADSIKDLWRRWHMSLSSWLRDYIYIPLGGSKKGKVRKYINILITFAISGMWHGTGMTFFLWGLAHGIYQIFGEILEPVKKNINEKIGFNKHYNFKKVINVIVTFSLFTIAVIMFRADNVKAGLSMLKSMVTVFNPWVFTDGTMFELGLTSKEWCVLLICMLFFNIIEIMKEKGIEIREQISKSCLVVRWGIYIGAIIFIMLFGTYGFGYDAQSFIYGGF